MPADPAGRDATASEVEAVAQALLDAHRTSMFAIPIPLDDAADPRQFRREARIAIAALDEVRAAGRVENPAPMSVEDDERAAEFEHRVWAAGRPEDAKLKAEVDEAIADMDRVDTEGWVRLEDAMRAACLFASGRQGRSCAECLHLDWSVCQPCRGLLAEFSGAPEGRNRARD